MIKQPDEHDIAASAIDRSHRTTMVANCGGHAMMEEPATEVFGLGQGRLNNQREKQKARQNCRS